MRVLVVVVLVTAGLAGRAGAQETVAGAPVAGGSGLLPPVRIEADGEAIDIGKLSGFGHAGPALGDIDGDGDRDLVVGDFPGYFWLFDNTGSDASPVYAGKGKLQAGGEDARTPVY